MSPREGRLHSTRRGESQVNRAVPRQVRLQSRPLAPFGQTQYQQTDNGSHIKERLKLESLGQSDKVQPTQQRRRIHQLVQ